MKTSPKSEEFDLVNPELFCEQHGYFKRELIICPMCEPERAKRQKQIRYETEIKGKN